MPLSARLGDETLNHFQKSREQLLVTAWPCRGSPKQQSDLILPKATSELVSPWQTAFRDWRSCKEKPAAKGWERKKFSSCFSLNLSKMLNVFVPPVCDQNHCLHLVLCISPIELQSVCVCVFSDKHTGTGALWDT